MRPFQFRYYEIPPQSILQKKENYPLNLTKESLADGSILLPFSFIHAIGIQSTPGIQFRINNGMDWIEIGDTGIYELDLEDKGEINSIQFNINSPIWGIPAKKNELFSIFIDIIYEIERTNVDISTEKAKLRSKNLSFLT